MTFIKIPNVAGVFYPDEAETLRQIVRESMSISAAYDILPEALIVPHAGYRYSGEVAGAAYAYVKNGREIFKRVLILGTPHRVYFPGIAASSAAYFETPLGNVQVDIDAVKTLCATGTVKTLDAAFEEEHSIEVQLPFLQEALDDFKIVPLLIGPGAPEEVCRVIEQLKQNGGLLIITSSDLSHFLNDSEARVLDAQTSEMIEQLAFEDLDSKRACGVCAIRGLLCYARKYGMKVQTVQLANSGETSGELFRVVGYGAYVITKE
ncbi:MAG: AmmeMemoRadiSam system protein B [Deltaproteobacteria bacterium]|nr:AmmeMemoRadiSam system protein B [Deltaproteobacteria bacterium]